MGDHRAARARVALVAAFGLLVGLAAMPVPSLAGPENEAVRQLELAEEDLAAGNFERAAASAASALRLDPGLHEALVTRGLALKGLGRVDDAGALLRAYRDLRGSLPLDARVEPALAAIEAAERADDGGRPPSVSQAPTEELPAGPLVVVYGPASDVAASEAAYSAARPFLGGQPAAAALPLSAAVPRSEGLLVLGADLTSCDGVGLTGDLESHLADAEAELIGLEPLAALEALTAAELHLACGVGSVERTAVSRLVAGRAVAYWVSGEPERARATWVELFVLEPERAIDGELDPTAQALQLDAKVTAMERPPVTTVDLRLPEGWTAEVDGVPTSGQAAELPRGRRVLRLTTDGGQVLGGVIDLEGDEPVLLGPTPEVLAAVYEPSPPAAVLKYVAGHLLELADREGAVSALLVAVVEPAPVVRRFDASGALVLTPQGRPRRAVVTSASPQGRQPAAGSVALLGGGLAATAVGVIVAAIAHGEGLGLQDEMGTVAGYDAAYDRYEAARTRERAGVGIAIGGGVVAAIGGITFVLPEPSSKEVRQR